MPPGTADNHLVAPGSRLSVVVRCHDQARFLGEALASLARQTRPPDEVVVVDDGSRDGSSAVAEGYRDTLPLVVLQRTPARGPAATFNDGVRASTGELVVALDADDRLSERYLELTEKALDEGPYDIAYGGEHRFGAETSRRLAPPFDAGELMVENLIHVSALFRRWVFDATGGFRDELDPLGMEDWEFWVAAVQHGARVTPVEGCWIEYRRHARAGRSRHGRFTSLRVHLRVRALHRSVVGRRHLARWAGRSLARNARRLVTR